MGHASDELRLTVWTSRLRGLAEKSARHQLLVDLAIAVGIATVSLAGMSSQHRLGPQTILFCAALCAPILLRPRGSVLCFAAVALVAALQWLLSRPQLADASVLITLYWVALDADLAEIAFAALTVETGAVIAAIRWSPSDPVKIWVGLSGLMVAAGMLGVTVRQRRALLLSLQEKAARLESERDQEGRISAAAERARIAREMHDIVSHNLTVMIALADGATYALESAPEQAIPAMQRVSATGRLALLEMRRLLGVLRDEPPPHSLEPQPKLSQLDDLLARVKAAGIPVAAEIDGDPRELSEGVQLAVFRIAQEALTNTLKHANRPTQARLLLRCRADEVELEVTNTSDGGLAVASPSGSASGGRGLRGMRERAAAYGGELDAGPLPHGGWRVRLRLHADTTAPVA
jgi:signal transduction histidine kinase